MYQIATIVYGVPVDEALDRAARELDYDLEQAGFEVLYSGSSSLDNGPGYLGVKLDELRTLDDWTRVADLKLNPSPEQRQEAERCLDRATADLPPELSSALQPLDVYVIWSSS